MLFDRHFLRGIRLILVILLALSLIPIFRMAFFSHPYGDDYSYGLPIRMAAENGGVFAALASIFHETIRNWFEWQGSFASIIMFTVQPAVWGEQYYCATTFLMIGALVFSVISFFRRVMECFFDSKESAAVLADIIAITVLLLSIQCVPDIAESFYWYNGAVYYTFFHALMLLEIGLLIGFVREDSFRFSRLFRILCLSFLISGSNYITALLYAEIVIVFTAGSFIKKKKIKWVMLMTAIWTLLWFAVSVFAPGNAARQGTLNGVENYSFFETVGLSIQEAWKNAIEWTTPEVICALLFLLPILWGIDTKWTGKRIWLIVSAIPAMFFLFASSYAPTLYAMQSEGAGRAVNIRFFLWIILCVFFMVCILLLLKQCIRMIRNRMPLPASWARNAGKAVQAVAFLSLFVVFIANHNDYTSMICARSLENGEALSYEQTYCNRLALLRNGQGEDVELPGYEHIPAALFVGDISDDPEYWVNQSVADWYLVQSVVLLDDTYAKDAMHPFISKVWYDPGQAGGKTLIHVAVSRSVTGISMRLGDQELLHLSKSGVLTEYDAVNSWMVWTFPYVFEYAGRYDLYFRAEGLGYEFSSFFSEGCALDIPEGSSQEDMIYTVSFGESTENTPMEIYAETAPDVRYLRLYLGDQLLAEYDVDAASVETDSTKKRWTLAYLFEYAGPYYLCFSASCDGVVFSDLYHAEALMVKRAPIIQVWHEGVEENQVELHVVTNMDIRFLYLDCEELETMAWTDNQATIIVYEEQMCKEWILPCSFPRGSTYLLSLRASADGNTISDPYPETVQILSANVTSIADDAFDDSDQETLD